MSELANARCATHPERGGPLACFRCGTFACEECSPSPSVLCARCASAAGGSPRALEVPRMPSLPVRLLPSLLLGFVPFWIGIAALRDVLGLPGTMGSIALLNAALALLAWVAFRFSERRAVAAFLSAQSLARRGSLRASAAALEIGLRQTRSNAAFRTRMLLFLAQSASDAGEHERAAAACESVLRSKWTVDRSIARFARLVAVTAYALRDDLGRAADIEAQIADPWPWSASSPALARALLLGRQQRYPDALSALVASARFAKRTKREDWQARVALLRAFMLERSGAGQDAIEREMVLGRRTGQEMLAGLTRSWPELAEFVARRMPQQPGEAKASAGE